MEEVGELAENGVGTQCDFDDSTDDEYYDSKTDRDGKSPGNGIFSIIRKVSYKNEESGSTIRSCKDEDFDIGAEERKTKKSESVQKNHEDGTEIHENILEDTNGEDYTYTFEQVDGIDDMAEELSGDISKVVVMSRDNYPARKKIDPILLIYSIETIRRIRNSRYDCEQCDEAFRYRHQLMNHKKTKHEGKYPYSCDICHKPFTKMGTWKDHVQYVHSNHRPYKCKVCNKSFKMNSNLIRHHKDYHEDGDKLSYQCEHCNKVFHTKAGLKSHFIVHSGEKPFKCKVCGKSFNRKNNLNEHKIVHTSEKTFECTDCGKKFNRPYSLKLHARNHLSVKPYRCEFCPASFSQLHALKSHTRLHTGERPFKCNLCDRAFVQLSTLQSHIKRHKGEKNFQCMVCGKSFYVKRQLVEHTRTHTGEKPFKCPYCSYRGALSNNLKLHMRNIHKIARNKVNTSKLSWKGNDLDKGDDICISENVQLPGSKTIFKKLIFQNDSSNLADTRDDTNKLTGDSEMVSMIKMEKVDISYENGAEVNDEKDGAEENYANDGAEESYENDSAEVNYENDGAEEDCANDGAEENYENDDAESVNMIEIDMDIAELDVKGVKAYHEAQENFGEFSEQTEYTNTKELNVDGKGIMPIPSSSASFKENDNSFMPDSSAVEDNELRNRTASQREAGLSKASQGERVVQNIGHAFDSDDMLSKASQGEKETQNIGHTFDSDDMVSSLSIISLPELEDIAKETLNKHLKVFFRDCKTERLKSTVNIISREIATKMFSRLGSVANMNSSELEKEMRENQNETRLNENAAFEKSAPVYEKPPVYETPPVYEKPRVAAKVIWPQETCINASNNLIANINKEAAETEVVSRPPLITKDVIIKVERLEDMYPGLVKPVISNVVSMAGTDTNDVSRINGNMIQNNNHSGDMVDTSSNIGKVVRAPKGFGNDYATQRLPPPRPMLKSPWDIKEKKRVPKSRQIITTELESRRSSVLQSTHSELVSRLLSRSSSASFKSSLPVNPTPPINSAANSTLLGLLKNKVQSGQSSNPPQDKNSGKNTSSSSDDHQAKQKDNLFKSQMLKDILSIPMKPLPPYICTPTKGASVPQTFGIKNEQNVGSTAPEFNYQTGQSHLRGGNIPTPVSNNDQLGLFASNLLKTLSKEVHHNNDNGRMAQEAGHSGDNRRYTGTAESGNCADKDRRPIAEASSSESSTERDSIVLEQSIVQSDSVVKVKQEPLDDFEDEEEYTIVKVKEEPDDDSDDDYN